MKFDYLMNFDYVNWHIGIKTPEEAEYAYYVTWKDRSVPVTERKLNLLKALVKLKIWHP